MKIATIMQGAALALFVAPPARAAAPPEPMQLVRAMQRLYGESKTYRDQGVVEVDYLNEDGTRRGGDRRPFSTAFVRPDRFRFEFKDESGGYGDLYVIWADGGSVRSWWTNRPQIQGWPSIADAVDAATGVSGGSAHLMANLLMSSSVGGVGPESLSEVRVVGEDVIGGRACWRLEGRGWLAFMSQSPLSFWIGKEAPHLCRVSYMFDIPGAKSRTTMTLTPEVDVKLDPGVFTFTPPAK
jgi:outer membrane lipoprotein-sorting protein